MKFTTLIVIIILAIVVILFLGWSRVPDMLANTMSKKLQVAVEIEDIGLSLNSLKIDNFEIGNPKGSILSKAFSSELIEIDAPLTRYLDQNIVIEQVLIDKVYLGLEFENSRSTKGNWTTIMGNLKSSSAPAAKEKEGEKRTLLIKSLVLSNIDTDVVYRQEGGKIQHLPTINRIELKNISSEGGFPIDQLMNSILGQMLQQVFIKQNLKNMLEDILDRQQGPWKQLLEPFKNLLQMREQDPEKELKSA
jgi:hypothetical protein